MTPSIGEIEDRLLKIKDIPKTVVLNECMTVTDVDKFIRSHLATAKHNSENKTYHPYHDRLCRVLDIVENK